MEKLTPDNAPITIDKMVDALATGDPILEAIAEAIRWEGPELNAIRDELVQRHLDATDPNGTEARQWRELVAN